MRQNAIRLATSLAFTACLTLSSCADRGPVVEFEGMTFGPDQPGKENSWGVHVFSINKRPFLVVFNQGGISTIRSTHDGFGATAVIDDVRLAKDERSIEYSCSTRDGVEGKILIAGQSFDLRKGNVLLLSAKSQPAGVEQIAVDLAKIPNPIADIEQLRSLKSLDSRVTAAIDTWQSD